MKKALLLITLITITIFSCKRQNAWTPEYEKSIYQTTYSAIGDAMKDSAQRKQLALLMVKRYKQLLPYGLNSISNDSLQKLSSKISREISKTDFAQNMRMVVAWSPEVESSFRASLFSNQVWQKVKADAATKDRFCNCLIASLKKIYPDSLVTPVPDSIYTKVVGDCRPIIAAGK